VVLIPDSIRAVHAAPGSSTAGVNVGRVPVAAAVTGEYASPAETRHGKLEKSGPRGENHKVFFFNDFDAKS
jgi:hypothetical protein